ncbi:hypothetical protein DY000_02029336 [Brassica cretica]|uniref:Peptidase C1A papain C-terminal domain-containing protein n=2 Tax=Brassica TaxID=3705 RepID=A0ABQ7DF52_BRACR|nr:hypothetical protein DY000_02029336 [Brassica cretica]
MELLGFRAKAKELAIALSLFISTICSRSEKPEASIDYSTLIPSLNEALLEACGAFSADLLLVRYLQRLESIFTGVPFPCDVLFTDPLSCELNNGSSLLLGDLKAGCCSSTVEVRLMRFWEARNVKKANKLMVSSFTCIGCDDTNAVGVLRLTLFSFRSYYQASPKFYLLPVELTTYMDPSTSSRYRVDPAIADKTDEAMAETVVSWIMLLSKLSRTEDESEMVTISGHQDVHINDEKCLLKALAHQPLRVAIDASAREFQFYSGDIFDGRCGVDLDHGVAAVGYGSSKGSDYIIVKNYWGPRWGEKIYIRVKRNSGKPEGLNQ